MAIWIHQSDPSLSTIIGTDKTVAGGLNVYDLAGNLLQAVSDPLVNNVDLRYGFPFDGETIDLLVASERENNNLAVYRVNPSARTLAMISDVPLGFEPLGLALYRSPVSKKYYAFVSQVAPPYDVLQYELADSGFSTVTGTLVRTIDNLYMSEGLVADDVAASLYVGEEAIGIWKYGAEPGDGTTRTNVDTVGGASGLTADVEGLTIYYVPDGSGYLLASSQGSDEFCVYERGGSNGYVGRFNITTGASIDAVTHTDGIDVTNADLGTSFPAGLFAAQDTDNPGANQNFKLVPWGNIASVPGWTVDTSWNPRADPYDPTPTPSPTPVGYQTPSPTPAYCTNWMEAGDVLDLRIGTTDSGVDSGWRYSVDALDSTKLGRIWDNSNAFIDYDEPPAGPLKLEIYVSGAVWSPSEGYWINMTAVKGDGTVYNACIYPPTGPLGNGTKTYYYLAEDGSTYCDEKLCELAEAAPTPPPCSGMMVSYWQAEGEASDYLGINDGTETGEDWGGYSTGRVGLAFNFTCPICDDPGYIDCGNDASLLMVNNFSVEFWIDPQPNGRSGFAVAHPAPNQTERSWAFRVYYPELMFDLSPNEDDTGFARLTAALPEGSDWYHVVGTFDDGGNAILYLDGVLAASDDIGYDSVYYSALPVLIGAATYPDGFSGLVDEVAIYNGILTPEMVLEHYQGSGHYCTHRVTPSPTTTSTPPGYWTPTPSPSPPLGYYRYYRLDISESNIGVSIVGQIQYYDDTTLNSPSNMTGEGSPPPYVVTSSNSWDYYGYRDYYAYDPYIGTSPEEQVGWRSFDPSWNTIDLGAHYPCTGYRIYSTYANFCPRSWRILASRTGAFLGEEVTLDTQTGIDNWGADAYFEGILPTPTPWGFETPSPTPVPAPTAPHLVVDRDDYDGDGTSDIAVYDPASGEWSVDGVTSGVVWSGGEGAVPAAGDFDGDGRADLAYFDRFSGRWYAMDASSGEVILDGEAWGAWGDVPAPGDYDGDGTADLATWRYSDGRWRIRDITNVWYGQVAGIFPVPGDYDGDGTTNMAMLWPSDAGGTNIWYVRGVRDRTWMGSGGIPKPMDFDGDGTTDLGYYQPANGYWYVRHLSSPTMYFRWWGQSGDVPAVGDFDGDGSADLTVFRDAIDRWWIRYSGMPYNYITFSAQSTDSIVTGATSY